MKIAILGGTGDIGEGLALRLSQKHDIIIGSREATKAQEAAASCNQRLTAKGLKAGIKGENNVDAAKDGDVIILAVRIQVAQPTLESIACVLDDNKIVVSPIVPMTKPKLCAYTPPEQGSAVKCVCSLMKPDIRAVAAFHTLPAPRLANLDDPLGFDVIVCSDDEEAKKTVMGLVSDLMGSVRPLDGGSLEEAKLVESLTPLLINLAIKNKMKPLSIKFL
jgi:8-hydroxy-5-deazaflavin:NADPH oxidoreductase